MSGKFMKVKRIIIPTLTMVIIASQLMGCSAASQSELLQMLQNGEQIEIEVASPIYEEQGEESQILWEQLALLDTNDVLRKAWDNTLGITGSGETKNGILYVNANGEQELNNTLRVALHNREFQKFLENESSIIELSEAVANQYVDTDIENEMKAVYMGINGYFNLLPDNQVNYCNADATLQRNEFLAMLFRAETPVSELTANKEFETAVGKSDLNIYAQGVADSSYLDIENKNLDNLTYNGTITRAEAVYSLVSRYFADDLAKVDIKGATFTDAKDGGDIAKEQGFTGHDRSKSYELTYALQNPDGGLPTDLYNALVVAKDKGLITSETRWDEGLTRAEAVEMLVIALEQDTSMEKFNFKQGTIEGYDVEIENTDEEDTNTGGSMIGGDIELNEDEKAALEEAEEVDETLNNEDVDTVEIVEVLDKTMYGIKNGNIRAKDTTASDIIDHLEVGATVHVTGKTSNGWYEAEWGSIKVYIASSLLSDTMPSQNAPATTPPPTQPAEPSQPAPNPGDNGIDNTSGWNGIPGSGSDWMIGL